MKTSGGSGIIVAAAPSESVTSNPLYELISDSKLTGPLVIVPSRQVLEQLGKSVYSTKKFIDSHIFQAAHVPNLFCSMRGCAIEVRGDRVFPAMRSSLKASPPITVLQSENIYDAGNSVRVLVVDRPLFGEYTVKEGGVIEGAPTSSDTNPTSGPSEYLAACPMVENDFIEKIAKLRKTFLLTPGYEIDFATRIKELAYTASSQLIRYLQPPVPELNTVRADIERVAYASLHAYLFAHLQDALGENVVLSKNCSDASHVRLDVILRELQAPNDVLVAMDKLIPLLNSMIVPDLAKLQRAVTPQQKLNYLADIVEKLNNVFKEIKIEHCSAEHLVAGMTMALILAKSDKAHVHVAHIEMYMAVHTELSMEKCAFAFATFNSCVEFLGKAIIP